MLVTFRRKLLDKCLNEVSWSGKVLDIGGKKFSSRGEFKPPSNVDRWQYLNIDKSTNPDILASAYNLPIADHIFDIVLMAELLEHLEYPEMALKEAIRVLKKGGKIIIAIPFLYPIHADPYDYQRWTHDKIYSVLRNIGYKNVKITSMGSVFAVIYDLIYVSLGSASKNEHSLKNKVIRKLLMPIFSKLCALLDSLYLYKSNKITTGYFIEAYT